MIFFIIGIIGAMLMTTFPEPFEKLQKKCAAFQKRSICVCIVLFACFIGYSAVYKDTLLDILLLGCLTLVVIAIFWSVSFPKPIVMLGDISYSFYLIHYFCVKLCTRVFMGFGFSSNAFVAFVLPIVCFAMTVAVSYVSYQVIEKRFANKLKGIFLKGQK